MQPPQRGHAHTVWPSSSIIPVVFYCNLLIAYLFSLGSHSARTLSSPRRGTELCSEVFPAQKTIHASYSLLQSLKEVVMTWMFLKYLIKKNKVGFTFYLYFSNLDCPLITNFCVCVAPDLSSQQNHIRSEILEQCFAGIICYRDSEFQN